MLNLDQALRQVEQTTDTLLSTEFADLAALCAALEDRADAITMLALVAQDEPAPQLPAQALARMTNVLVRGEEATRKLIGDRQQLAGEWGRLSQLARGTGEDERSSEVDVIL